MTQPIGPNLDSLRQKAARGFELGLTQTSGQLEIVSTTPSWALEPTDVSTQSLSSAYDLSQHGHSDVHEHRGVLEMAPARAEDLFMQDSVCVVKIDGVQANAVEVSGFRPVEVKIKDLLSTDGLLGRVLLVPRRGVGFLPVTIMPDMQRPGKGVKIITFNEPYDASPDNKEGIDEGKLLGLALEIMTKEQAGFGGHSAGKLNPFEGGHLTVGALASRDIVIKSTLQVKGHDGTHDIIAGSVVNDLNVNSLTSKDMPKPNIVTIEDITVAAESRAIMLYWRDNLIGPDGKPLRAIHPGASELVVGDMIHNLGKKGLDAVGNFVVMASGAK